MTSPSSTGAGRQATGMDGIGSWSRGRLQRVAACPACGEDGRRDLIMHRRDNDLRMPDTWRMYRCRACRSLWLDPRPDEASLGKAYSHYYTHDLLPEAVPTAGLAGLAWRMVHGYLAARYGMRREPSLAVGALVFRLAVPWRRKLDYYARHLDRARFPVAGRLLDIGCGNGGFLARAAEMGWRARGCEPDPKAVETCRRQGLDVIEGDAFDARLEVDGGYDVVTASHVLEHVPNPRALVRRVHELLRPGGTAWFALPNPDALGLRVFGGDWEGLHPPYHLCIPTQAVAAGWLRDAGFVNVEFLRRGLHGRGSWATSGSIAVANGAAGVLHAARAGHVVGGLLATISTRHVEETVVRARKLA